MKRTISTFEVAIAAVIAAGYAGAPLEAAEPASLLAESQKRVPAPPWPAGDERGMANAIGPGTWSRCAWHLGQPRAKAYEVAQVRSNTSPKTPFAGPYVTTPKPTGGLPRTSHAVNSERSNEGAEFGQEGTQIDALGHFGSLKEPWDGQPPFPVDSVRYFGGYTQQEVKPTPDSPLLKLGMEKAPPIVTTAVLLDAKTLVGGGRPMKAGELVTAAHIEEMLRAQGLTKRGILPGDVVYVHTGWGDHWKDPDTEKVYYSMAPGLSYDAMLYLGKRRIVAIGIDAPAIDPIAEGQLQGKAGPPPGTPPGQPFAAHTHMLTETGIHLLENAKLDEMARDKVWTSCTMILPLREKGAAGSGVRPVAYGVPRK